MRNVFLLVAFVFSLFTSSLFADWNQRGQISDFLTSPRVNKNQAKEGSDNPLVTSACKIRKVTAIATSSPGTVVLYDSASAASGTVLEDISIATSGNTEVVIYPDGQYIKAENGIYADVTNCFVIVEYEAG